MFDLSKADGGVRARSPIRSTVRSGQLLWGDAFYFRDLICEDMDEHLKSPDRMLKLACIADIMHFPDYTLEILEYLTLNYGEDSNYNFADIIMEGLSQFPDLVNQGLDSLPIVSKIRDYVSNLDLLKKS